MTIRASTVEHVQGHPLSEAEFDTLVRAHYGHLCDFVRRLVTSDAIAEEIVQDVLTAVWIQRATWAPQDPLTFLYRASRNRAVSHYRRSRVQGRWMEPDGLDRATTRSVAEEYETRMLETAVAQAIAELPERCRMVYQLSREQEMTYAQIAAALAVSVKTVETHMSRALAALRKAVARQR